MTCPGSARRIGPQSPRQHGAAAAPALALTPACVGHQLSLPRVWDTSSHSRVCGTPAVTPMCAGHQLSLARVWDTSSHSSVCGTPALTPACVGRQLSLPRVWDASSHSRVCGTPAVAGAARYSQCFSLHMNICWDRCKKHLEDDEDKETPPLS